MNFADKGDPSLLVIAVPEEFGEGGRAFECFAMPVLSRSGGFLVCCPRGCFSEEILVDMMSAPDAGSIVGPSKGISVSLVEEGLDGSPVLVGAQSNCLLVDLLDDGLSWICEYDAATDPVTIVSFSEEYPNAVPMNSEVVLVANEWAASQQGDRVNFYSAQLRGARDRSTYRNEGQSQKIYTSLCTSKKGFECTSHGSVVNSHPADEASHSPTRAVRAGRCTKCSKPFRSSVFKHQGCSVSFCRVAGTPGECVVASSCGQNWQQGPPPTTSR